MTKIENYGGKNRTCIDCGAEGHFTHMKGHECEPKKANKTVTRAKKPAKKAK